MRSKDKSVYPRCSALFTVKTSKPDTKKASAQELPLRYMLPLLRKSLASGK